MSFSVRLIVMELLCVSGWRRMEYTAIVGGVSSVMRENVRKLL
ncbi:hypothetical protein [Granulicella paludicola]|nr:hypothetical protein [Granulicella paludicola]